MKSDRKWKCSIRQPFGGKMVSGGSDFVAYGSRVVTEILLATYLSLCL